MDGGNFWDFVYEQCKRDGFDHDECERIIAELKFAHGMD